MLARWINPRSLQIVTGLTFFELAYANVLLPKVDHWTKDTFQGSGSLFETVLLAPCLEETIFRLPLVSQWSMIKSFGLLTNFTPLLICSSVANPTPEIKAMQPLAQCLSGTGVWATVVSLVSNDPRVKKCNMMVLASTSVFNFALLHALNFKVVDRGVLSTVAVFQGVCGIMITGVTLMFGFRYAVYYHIL